MCLHMNLYVCVCAVYVFTFVASKGMCVSLCACANVCILSVCQSVQCSYNVFVSKLPYIETC